MKLTRRTLLMAGGIVGGGLLIGSLGLGTYLNTYNQRSAQRSALPQTEGDLVASFILIEPDGRVRILSPHTEMGQGSNTSLMQIVLDELDADPQTTTIELAPALPQWSNAQIVEGLFEEFGISIWSEEFTRSIA
ncbi:MAG: molybdopterin cofactor-binding domain-containing protein, partial [Myxococcota bacterium]